MSRSGYSEDVDDQWALIRWRGAVASAIRGKRGQAFLRELRDALDAMPEKKLIAYDLQNECGVCAIGSVGVQRGVDMTPLDPEDPDRIAATFGIATPLVQEIEYMNDEAFWTSDPAVRWKHMRAWVEENIRKGAQGD